MPDHKDIPRGLDAAHPLGYVQASDPGAVGAFRPWLVTDDDTTPTTLTDIKIRNAANSGWISLFAAIPAAAVSSVFGRTGAVVAVEGDYSLDKLSDVTLSGVAAGNFIRHNGTAWLNTVISAGDVPDLDAAKIVSGVFNIGRLAVGTPDGTKFVRDDGTLAVPSGTGAPTDADYLVKTAHGSLSAERVVTDTPSITVDWATAGQAKFKRAALTGDVTASADDNATTIKNDVALGGNPTAATQAEGNDSTRIATTAFVKRALDHQAEMLIVAISDETTAITTGTAKITFYMPFNCTLVEAWVGLSAQSTSGNPAFDVNKAGVSIFSTTITVDANEDTSLTAATPPVISTSSFTKGDKMTVDIDTAGTGAKGAKLYLSLVRT